MDSQLFSRGMLLYFCVVSTLAFADSKIKPAPKIETSPIGAQYQFDYVRVIAPASIQKTNNPASSRAYLPICPPGSTYVSGVNPNLLQSDYGPNFPYCNCLCKGICNGLPGVTSPGGKQPIYTAAVTCAVNARSFSINTIQKPHQFYYCQSGNCTTNPLPADASFAPPMGGGVINTVKVDFQSCAIAVANGCTLPPDPTSRSRLP